MGSETLANEKTAALLFVMRGWKFVHLDQVSSCAERRRRREEKEKESRRRRAEGQETLTVRLPTSAGQPRHMRMRTVRLHMQTNGLKKVGRGVVYSSRVLGLGRMTLPELQ